MDFITVLLLVSFSFTIGIVAGHGFTVRHYSREFTRLAEELWTRRHG